VSSTDGATIVKAPVVGVTVVAVYLNVVVPVAPFESKAAIVYVPVTHAALEPA